MKLLEEVGKGVSIPALDKSLAELWSKLRITRVDYDQREGAAWDVLQRWSPEAVAEGVNCSVGEALSAVLSKYLECVIAADQQELESFFGNFVPRSRVRDSVNALMSARPRRGSCNEYCRSMSGAASSSTMPSLQVLPQKSVNQRPTTALLSSCIVIRIPFSVVS